jgi:hypothetical protein
MNQSKVFVELSKDIKEIKKLLLGNGQIGLCESVRKNTNDIDILKNDTFSKWIVRAGIVFSGVMSTLVAIKQFKG